MKQKHLLMALFGILSFIVSSCGESTVSPSGVTLNKTTLTLKKGMNEKLIAKVVPEDVSNSKVIWTSSDNSVVSILDGECTAINGGTATVTATTEDGKFSASCVVIVAIDVTSIAFPDGDITLKRGNQTNLVVKILPEDATNKTLIWKTSDASIATVDASGKITAINNGVVKITATTEDGKFSASCVITVTIDVTSIVFPDGDINIERGNQTNLVVKVLPEDATNKTLIWKTSDASIATVDASGKITAINKGVAKIIATTEDGTVIGTCNVFVVVNVTGISLSKKDLTITEGKKNVNTATVMPSDASNTDVTWSSNNESVASVSSAGEITAIKPGKASITATSSDKVHSAACLITVTSAKSVSYHPYGDNKNW